MQHKSHYGTISEAIDALRSQGFSIDFNLEEATLVSAMGRFNAADFSIVDVYRYEGDSDPADEAAVYALQSAAGLKGILVAGYGTSTDAFATRVLGELGTSESATPL